MADQLELKLYTPPMLLTFTMSYAPQEHTVRVQSGIFGAVVAAIYWRRRPTAFLWSSFRYIPTTFVSRSRQ